MRLKNSLAIPIVTLFILVALSALVIGYFINLRSLHQSLEAKEAEKANGIYFIVRSIITEEVNKLSTLSKVIKENPELVNSLIHYSVSGRNLEPLKKIMDRLYPKLATQIFYVTDSKGILVYSPDPKKERKDTYKESWGIDEALDGKEVLAVGKGPCGWVIRAFMPVYSAKKLYGIIVLGAVIDDDFAQKIAVIANTPITLASMSGALASSLTPDQKKTIDFEMVKQTLWQRSPFFINDHTYHKFLMFAPLMVVDETFCLIVQTDTKVMYELLEYNKSKLLKTSIVIFLSIILISSALAIYLIRPLKKLENKARDIFKKYSGKEMKMATSANEVDTLVQVFDSMIETINNHITERKAAEDALSRSNEELRATEEELRATNEELQSANDELREAQEQLIRSEKLAAIGKLAGGVGHELRNPLGAIKNAVYYIKGKLTNSELAKTEPRIIEFLGIMDDEISSSDKIINDLLNFSRVAKPAVSPAKIRKVMEDALSHLTVPGNIEVINKLNANLPEVEIDADQIRQVLVNIATNAIQAMPEGGKLTIDAKKGDKFLEVAISDTGDGISEDVIGKIFDPLFTTRAKGIGLGLAVCKSIIERHEGAIEVESKLGKGTTFTVKLPLKAN